MSYPDLLILKSESDYMDCYYQTYCKYPITTFDGISVFFYKERFDHAFYESSNRDGIKDTFSHERAERMNWIKAALMDPLSDIRVGWDSTKKRYDSTNRVTIVVGNYVVVIRMSNTNRTKARFITAYLADKDALPKILASPKWI